jgi:hypothetical protein
MDNDVHSEINAPKPANFVLLFGVEEVSFKSEQSQSQKPRDYFIEYLRSPSHDVFIRLKTHQVIQVDESKHLEGEYLHTFSIVISTKESYSLKNENNGHKFMSAMHFVKDTLV